jgi:Kazal-type serine protease inhibitor domain
MKIILVFLIMAASCGVKNTPPQKMESNEKAERPAMHTNNTDRPTDEPPSGYTKTDEPKPLSNVSKDCQDKAKATKNICQRLYDPVCGCNNVTYANDCLAKNDGVLKWTKGACK